MARKHIAHETDCFGECPVCGAESDWVEEIYWEGESITRVQTCNECGTEYHLEYEFTRCIHYTYEEE